MILVKISLANALGNKTLLSKTLLARKLRLHHPSGQKQYISKLRHITRQYNLLPRLRALENHQKCPPSPGAIKDYKGINKLLFKATSKANSGVQRLHMSNVQSSRMVKISQLHLRLVTLLIQIIDKERKIKLKTFTKISDITERKWWLSLDINTLLHQNLKAMREFHLWKKNCITLRSTYLEERAW